MNSRIEKDLINILAAAQQLYLDLAQERAKQGDVFAVAKAVDRANEAGRRLDKLRQNRWIA